jgi:hypothetical protein
MRPGLQGKKESPVGVRKFRQRSSSALVVAAERVGVCEQVERRDVERRRKRVQLVEARVAQATFDAAEVRDMDLRGIRERLLAQTTFGAKLADRGSERCAGDAAGGHLRTLSLERSRDLSL